MQINEQPDNNFVYISASAKRPSQSNCVRLCSNAHHHIPDRKYFYLYRDKCRIYHRKSFVFVIRRYVTNIRLR